MQLLMSRLGTLLYMSPQILNGEPYTILTDVWSLGVIFFQLLFGKLPFYETNIPKILEKISKPLIFPEKPKINQEIKILIQKMLEIHEKDRISWDNLISCPIFYENSDSIDSIKNLNFNENNSFEK